MSQGKGWFSNPFELGKGLVGTATASATPTGTVSVSGALDSITSTVSASPSPSASPSASAVNGAAAAASTGGYGYGTVGLGIGAAALAVGGVAYLMSDSFVNGKQITNEILRERILINGSDVAKTVLTSLHVKEDKAVIALLNTSDDAATAFAALSNEQFQAFGKMDAAGKLVFVQALDPQAHASAAMTAAGQSASWNPMVNGKDLLDQVSVWWNTPKAPATPAVPAAPAFNAAVLAQVDLIKDAKLKTLASGRAKDATFVAKLNLEILTQLNADPVAAANFLGAGELFMNSFFNSAQTLATQQQKLKTVIKLQFLPSQTPADAAASPAAKPVAAAAKPVAAAAKPVAAAAKPVAAAAKPVAAAAKPVAAALKPAAAAVAGPAPAEPKKAAPKMK